VLFDLRGKHKSKPDVLDVILSQPSGREGSRAHRPKRAAEHFPVVS
jgi:hypothetical protein